MEILLKIQKLASICFSGARRIISLDILLNLLSSRKGVGNDFINAFILLLKIQNTWQKVIPFKRDNIEVHIKYNSVKWC